MGDKDLAIELLGILHGPTSKNKSPHPTQAVQEESTSEKLIQEWVNSIRQFGDAHVHGKLNPFWFDKSETPSPLTTDPPYTDHGEINHQHPNLTHGAHPTADILININSHSKDKETQYLILSAPVNPQATPNPKLVKEYHEKVFAGEFPRKGPEYEADRIQNLNTYNTKILGDRFKTPWREITWQFWISNQPLVAGSRNSSPTPVRFNIFLPNDLATKVFSEMKSHPKLVRELFASLYPKTHDPKNPLIINASPSLTCFEMSNNFDLTGQGVKDREEVML